MWKPKVHYRFHNSLPSVPIPSHINPVHAITSSFWKIYFNITFHLASSRFKKSFSYRFPKQNHTCISLLSHVRPILCSGLLLDLIIRLIFVEEYKSRISWLWSLGAHRSDITVKNRNLNRSQNQRPNGANNVQYVTKLSPFLPYIFNIRVSYCNLIFNE